MLELHGKKWVYYVDLTAPDPNKTPGEPRGYRVSIVVENEPGHYPTGGGDKSPWYWDEETCRLQNEKLGFDEHAAWEIVASSIGAQNLERAGRL